MNARIPAYELRPGGCSVVVLGADLAGAFRAASHGARVALLEPGEFGGTCVNFCCVPKKACGWPRNCPQRIVTWPRDSDSTCRRRSSTGPIHRPPPAIHRWHPRQLSQATG